MVFISLRVGARVSGEDDFFFLTASGISDQVRCSVYQWDFALSLQVVSEDALVHWLDQYNSSADTCTHAYWLVLSCCFTFF